MSGGKSISVSSRSSSTDVTAVRISAEIPARRTIFTTQRRSRDRFPAPKAWAAGMQNPAQMPFTNPITRKVRAPVAPTAARALVPTSFPTTAASAML